MKYIKYVRKQDVDPVAGRRNRGYRGTFIVEVMVLGRKFTTKVRSFAHRIRDSVAESIAKTLLGWLRFEPRTVTISVNGKKATAEYSYLPHDTIASIKKALASIAHQFSPA